MMDLEEKMHYFLFAPPHPQPPKGLPGCRLVHLAEDVFSLSGLVATGGMFFKS